MRKKILINKRFSSTEIGMLQCFSCIHHCSLDQVVFKIHTGGSCHTCGTKHIQVDVLCNLNTITPDKTFACENLPADKTSVQRNSSINPQLNAN